MTWAGKQSEQPRSFQSPETYLLLTFSFIERAISNDVGRCKSFFFYLSLNFQHPFRRLRLFLPLLCLRVTLTCPARLR
jgi:hypothetical protein